jgi:hypothetical protein
MPWGDIRNHHSLYRQTCSFRLVGLLSGLLAGLLFDLKKSNVNASGVAAVDKYGGERQRCVVWSLAIVVSVEAVRLLLSKIGWMQRSGYCGKSFTCYVL